MSRFVEGVIGSVIAFAVLVTTRVRRRGRR
jgi:hypothetical protein